MSMFRKLMIDVLPSSLTSDPSFYMYDSDSTFKMLQPYIDQASSFIQDVLAQLPALTKAFKDTFEMAGTSKLEFHFLMVRSEANGKKRHQCLVTNYLA